MSMRELSVETRLSTILARGKVEAGFRALSPEDAVDRLLRPVLLAEGFSPEGTDAALEGIRNREGAGSTSFGAVALPHARVGGLGRIVGALGANASGVFDSGPPGIRIVLAFASPASATVEHLQFLAQVARLLRQEETVADLLDATDPGGLLEAIRRRER
ncbi:MAG: PTS sugar transporter subunit IIA [Holophagales bacterium]|nr:PTS sugar transporter subunit IIA [Holophagales bacterium]